MELGVVIIVVRMLGSLDRITLNLGYSSLKFLVYGVCTLLSISYFLGLGFIFKNNIAGLVYEGVFPSHPISNSTPQVLGESTGSVFPIAKEITEFPETTAKAILVADRKSDKILYGKDIYTKYASASTTKLMTALVALDVYEPEELVAVPKICTELESTKADFPEGTSYSVQNLVTVMLIESAGDAACALANGKMSQGEFIFLMNRKAHLLGLNNSYFTNPIGLDGVDSSHFSTAHDLYKLSVAATKNNLIKSAVKTKEYTIKSLSEVFIGKYFNTNILLFEIPQTVGIKTGTTTEAGQVLIYEYADSTKDLIIVVMGSEDRFSDVRAILYWTLLNYSWE